MVPLVKQELDDISNVIHQLQEYMVTPEMVGFDFTITCWDSNGERAGTIKFYKSPGSGDDAEAEFIPE